MSQQDYKSATINYELPFDVTAGKHKGNPNSRAANLRVISIKVTLRERVRIFIAGCDYRGATVHELSDHLGKPVHSISGRLSELKIEQKIFDSGRSRNGASVLVVDRKWMNGEGQ
jgi:hypothetical protein